MGYVGGSLTVFFDSKSQQVTNRSMRRMAERGVDRMHEWTVINTPIGGQWEGSGMGGNLRSSWYTTPVRRVHVPGVQGYRSSVETRVDYAPYVEHGTGLWGPRGTKYLIEPRTPGGWLHWIDPRTGEDVFAKRVWHPGSPGHHMVAIACAMVEQEVNTGLFESILAEWSQTIERRAA